MNTGQAISHARQEVHDGLDPAFERGDVDAAVAPAERTRLVDLDGADVHRRAPPLRHEKRVILGGKAGVAGARHLRGLCAQCACAVKPG